ncbi:MAG: hypothetical protein JNJ57_05725 [Saprospiraceae bacterium]|nr:hypothetical protein [Saprospiraceae bacterium]
MPKTTNNLTNSLIIRLSKAEITALGKYLKSPFFSNKHHLYLLFNALKNTPTRQKENIFAQIFPGKAFNQHKWNKALSDLNQCIRDFLATRQFQQRRDIHRLMEAEALFLRDNYTFFQRTAHDLLKETPGKTTLDRPEVWWVRFQVKILESTHPLSNRIKGIDDTLNNIERSLDTYYFISKLQIACNRLSGTNVLNWKDSQENLVQLLAQANLVGQTDQSPLLKTYCSLTGLMANAGVAFEDFFEVLQLHASQLEPKELWNVVYMAFNYCSSYLRFEPKQALDWYLKLFEFSTTHQIFGASIWEDAFLNFGVIFAKAGNKVEFDRLLHLDDSHLPEERRKEAVNLISAYWSFYHQDYLEVQEKLVKISTRHPRYALMWHALNVRNIVMLFIEGKYINYSHVENALNRFKDFLKGQTAFSELLCKSFVELIWFIQKICQVWRYRRLTKEILFKELDKRQPASRDWIELVLNRLPN